MPLIRASASLLIGAPAPVVYAILADYRDGHPGILPAGYFENLEIEQGGVGAGTIIRFRMRMLGATRAIRAAITEPIPGRVLLETALDSTVRTTFTVTPDAADRSAQVTIATEWTTPGARGWIERLLVPPKLRRIFALELANLDAAARGRERAGR